MPENPLSSNAAKYGALGSDAGHLDISWSLDRQNLFVFTWNEGGLSGLQDASRAGFGSQLLNRIAPAYFNGQASSVLKSLGMEYVLTGQISTD